MNQVNPLPDKGATGFYGKFPSLGDFVTRRLPAQFVQPWDQWLRESLAASREQLDQEWLDHYLTSPLWRFVLTPGIAGQTGWAGVLMPSVDRVGRYFHLTLARPLTPGANPFLVLSTSDWFEHAEAVALSALEDRFELTEFDTRVLGLPSQDRPDSSPPAEPPGSGSQDTWRIVVPSNGQLSQACPILAGHALEELFFAYSLWWTAGSERVEPSLLTCQGLPAPAGFGALLTGDWAGRGWLRIGPA